MVKNIKQAAEQQLIELIQICNICKNHEPSPDSYTAPAFVDFLDTLLTTEDIPMESNISSERSRDVSKDPKDNIWDDNIKNFVLDINSVVIDSKFSICVVLAEFGYTYEEATIYLLSKKYGGENAIMMYITPIDEEATNFQIVVRRNDIIEFSSTSDSDYLLTTLMVWYNPGHTLIFCHDTGISPYIDILTMMPDSVWSIFCNTMNFVEASKLYSTKKLNNSNIRRSYVCPIFSHKASTETRAVGSGPVKFLGSKFNPSYVGSMNYYSRCIRGSKHSSGRCYDCQILHNLLVKLDQFREKNNKSPIIGFIPSFLDSSRNKQNIVL